MEEKRMNEKESLELISEMIRNTRTQMEKHAGLPFLLWGYTTVGISLLIWYLLKETGDNSWHSLWFLLPVIALPLTWWHARKQQKMVKTYIERIIGYVWAVFGISGFLLSCTSYCMKFPILFVILLLMGMATALTGLIIRMNLIVAAGIIGVLAAFGSLYMNGLDQVLLFGFTFIPMMVIPGHYMNRKAARFHQKKNAYV